MVFALAVEFRNKSVIDFTQNAQRQWETLKRKLGSLILQLLPSRPCNALHKFHAKLVGEGSFGVTSVSSREIFQ